MPLFNRIPTSSTFYENEKDQLHQELESVFGSFGFRTSFDFLGAYDF